MPSCKALETWQICGSDWRQSVSCLDTLRYSQEPPVSHWKLNGFDGPKCKEVLHPAGRSRALTSRQERLVELLRIQPLSRENLAVRSG
jgi:hypothetical protein